MKIVHIHQFFNEGMGYQENLMPYYQQKLGHDVVLITSTLTDGFTGTRERSAGETTENGFRVIRLPVSLDLPHKFVVFKDLLTALEREKPDYIYHHNCASPSIGTVVYYKRHHPTVFLALDNHSDRTISIRNPFVFWLYYKVIWQSFIKHWDAAVDLYFGVTPARCLFIHEQYGVNLSKIRLLPLGADVDHLPTGSDRQQFWSDLGVDPHTLIFIHGGKMTPEKNIHRILSAFSRLKQENVRLVLFGTIDDPRVQELMNHDLRIQHIGWLNRESTLNALRFSDVGIWNSQHTTLLEDAVACNLPMILRYYGSTCHLIDRSGLFLYDGSVREIEDRMQFLIDNPELLPAMKNQAVAHQRLISYEAIAQESCSYSQSREPQPIHQKLMNPQIADFDYPGFRSISPSGCR